jgi:hypothetical protein
LLGTTLVILLVHWITGSWAVGAVAGIIAGGVAVALYPLLLGRK